MIQSMNRSWRCRIAVAFAAVATTFALATPARAQDMSKEDAAALKASFLADLEGVKGKFVQLAGAFPDDKMAWRPMEGVRSVAEVLVLIWGLIVASIVAMETIYVTWFCYICLLVLYNPAFFGTDHWFTFVACGAFAIWAVYLAQRLWWFQRVAPAVRYAIPTGIIAYNVVEILEKWGKITEIWVQPGKYALEIGLAIGALVIMIVMAVVSPARRIVNRQPG